MRGLFGRLRVLSGGETRPQFVTALCVAALLIAIAELAGLLRSPVETYRRVLLGFDLSGGAARAAGITHIAIYCVGAVGLWSLRTWARIGAMAYLGYVLVSFVVWGVRGYRSEGVMVVMAWQMFVLPFVTFCFMYLQRGGKYFR